MYILYSVGYNRETWIDFYIATRGTIGGVSSLHSHISRESAAGFVMLMLHVSKHEDPLHIDLSCGMAHKQILSAKYARCDSSCTCIDRTVGQGDHRVWETTHVVVCIGIEHRREENVDCAKVLRQATGSARCLSSYKWTFQPQHQAKRTRESTLAASRQDGPLH